MSSTTFSIRDKSRRQLKIRRGEIEQEPRPRALPAHDGPERISTAPWRSLHAARHHGLHAAVSEACGSCHPAHQSRGRHLHSAQPDPPDLRRRDGRGERLPRVYLLFTVRGRKRLRPLVARKNLRDPIATLKYHSACPPRGDTPLQNIEKSSTGRSSEPFVMAATGIVAWFDNTFIRLVESRLRRQPDDPLLEAWLATLAILVWHFYLCLQSDVHPETCPG
jgi:hypothetical protein